MSTERLDNEGTVRLDNTQNNQGTTKLNDNAAANKLDSNESKQRFDFNLYKSGAAVLQAKQSVQDTDPGQKKPDNIFTPGQVIQLRGDDYTIDGLISQNSGEAVIYKVTSNNKPLVLKYYKQNYHLPEKVIKKILGNPQDRIIRIYEFGNYNDQDFEIMEYAEGGTLDDYLRENGPIKDIEKLKNIVGQINEGLKQLHDELRIIYQDLKPNNIYFRDRERTSVILADFGISSVLPDGKNEAEVRADVTTVYAAPELARKGNETHATVDPLVDYFALGITMLHMWLGEIPFKDINPSARDKMIRDKNVNFPQDMPTDCRTLIQGLIHPLSNDRWRNQAVETWLSGASLHGNYQKATINYTSQVFKGNESYASPVELAELMDRDNARGISYLYDGTVTSWIKKAGDLFLAEEIKSIVSAYSDDKEAGLYRAIYTLDPDRPFITHGGKKCANDAEIADALMEESGYYMNELKNNKNALFYLNILATGGNNGKTVVEKFQKYFEEYAPKRALALIYLFLMGSEGITVGSKTYKTPDEAAAETDSEQIELIKQAVQKNDSVFLVWLSDCYGSFFESTQEFSGLPAWDKFFLLGKFPFLSYKDLVKDWETHSSQDLQGLIISAPGRVDLFETYLRQDLPFKTFDEKNWKTPLCFLAANFERVNEAAGCELVRFMHKNGVDINESSSNGTLPLVLAISQRNVSLTKLLLELGADPNKKQDYPPLLWALFQNEDGEEEEKRIELAKLLLEHKADVNAAYKGVTPLISSIIFQSPQKVDLVSRIIAAGANVNMGNNKKQTPLMLAAHSNSPDVVDLLLKNGAKKEAVDVDGYTAFICAKEANNKQMAQLLDPGKALIGKARLFAAVKAAISILSAAWVFLTIDVLARAVLSLHLIYPVLLGVSILISHLLAAYLLIVIHGLKGFLSGLRGTFNFIGSSVFYIVSIPIAVPLLAALLHRLTKFLPENITTMLSLPAEFLTRSSSGFTIFSLYILFLALFMGAALFFSKVTGKFSKVMQIYRQYS